MEITLIFFLYSESPYLCVIISAYFNENWLIENIAFTKEDYIQKTTNESMPSFDELLDTIVAFVEENGGSLEDAVDMANDTYFQL